MAIRIVRNEQGNCINFYGSSNPAYWNACLSGEVDSTETSTVNVINDIITSETGVTQYEFFRVPYTEFVDEDGNGFADAQATADYITEKANVVGLGGGGTDLTGETVCFKLDDTSTSIMLDNGYSYGVNTIKAVDTGDGLITLQSQLGDIIHFTKLDHTNVCDGDGIAISGGLNDIINYLNELFTVGAFEAVVISDPYSTMVADIGGIDAGYTLEGSTAIDPIGDDIFTNSSSGNYAGLLSTATIDQAGEYFTFDIRGEGQIGFGLVHTQASYDAGRYSGSATYANPSSFAVGNSAHYGFQFSHWFHPTPNGSWANYGANTSYSGREHWGANWDKKQDWLDGENVKVRVGIDANSFISIETLNDDGTWGVHARTSYPVAQGAEFNLGIKTANSSPRVSSIPKVHLLEPAAPVMSFRYVESPDGYYSYPLFATQEEANYYYVESGGTITDPTQQSHTHLYADDPSFTNWYMPLGFNQMNYELTPQEDGITTFKGNTINWTEITTLTNAQMKPSAFSQTDITVDELSAVNIQVHPPDAGFTTSVLNDGGSGLHMDNLGLHLAGTAPEVTDNNVNNPSDTYTITIRRSNSYGDTDSTFNLIVNNLTALEETIDGFQQHTGSILGGLMQDGSVYQLQHQGQDLADAHRFIIPNQWVADNVLPYLLGAGDTYVAGFLNGTHDTSTLETSDFDFAITWEYVDANSHKFSFVRDGSVMTGGGSANVSTKSVTVNSTTNAVYDFAIELDGTSAWLIACNVNNIMNEASPNDGGIFSHYAEVTNYDTGHTGVHFGVMSMEGGLEEGAATLTVIDTPTPASSNLTSWAKALNFSGGSEHLKQATQSTGSNAVRMSGLGQLASANSDSTKTSSDTYSRPWATAVVFQTPNNNTNQHIWNSGEGAGSGDDNIYLRMTGANGELYFGWGREGVGYNEYHIGNFGGSYNQSSGQWWGIYISHDGTRLSAADAEDAAKLTNAFDIRLMSTNDVTPVFDTLYDVGNDVNNWVSKGVRMDRTIGGDFTIGGRGANRSFHGKVASMVVTTLRKGAAKPLDDEIKLMLTDPIKWEEDKHGQLARYSYTSSNFTYGPSNSNSKYATQVWLMGDGTSDSYANGIRNHVDPTDQNYVNLQLNSMVSNDIENVNIPGLS